MDLASRDPFESAETLATYDQPGSAWNRFALATAHPDPFSALTAWQLSFREAMDAEHLVLVRESEAGLVQMAVLRLGQTFCLGPMESSWLFGCNVLGPGGVDVLHAVEHHHRDAGDDGVDQQQVEVARGPGVAPVDDVEPAAAPARLGRGVQLRGGEQSHGPIVPQPG